MDEPFEYRFEWDSAKARSNAKKHGITFERAATIFLDPSALSLLEVRKKMKREYDFSKAVRGRFYQKDALLRIPIYLDSKLQKQVQRIAQDKGKNIEEVVTELLRKEVNLLKP